MHYEDPLPLILKAISYPIPPKHNNKRKGNGISTRDKDYFNILLFGTVMKRTAQVM